MEDKKKYSSNIDQLTSSAKGHKIILGDEQKERTNEILSIK